MWTGEVLTAALWNLEIRDKLRALGLSGIQEGEILLGDGASSFSLVDGSGLAAVPGTILEYPGTTPPAGYLHADGSLISRTTYADLFAAIGTLFGSGTGTLYPLYVTGALYQVDLADVPNPTLLGHLGVGTWNGLGNIGSILYAVTSTGALYQVDLADVPNPTLLGDLGSGTWQGLGNIGSILYAVTNAGDLYQVDLSDVPNPTLLGDLGSNITIHGLGNIGSILYAVTNTGALYQVDLSDVPNPTLLGDLGSGTWNGLGNIGSILYAIKNVGSLYQVDLADVPNSTLLGHLGVGNAWQGLGNLPGQSGTFRLPSLPHADSRFIVIIKT